MHYDRLQLTSHISQENEKNPTIISQSVSSSNPMGAKSHKLVPYPPICSSGVGFSPVDVAGS